MRNLLTVGFTLGLCTVLTVATAGCGKNKKTTTDKADTTGKQTDTTGKGSDKAAKLTIVKLWFEEIKLPAADEGKTSVGAKGGVEIKPENVDADVDIAFETPDGVKVEKVTIKKGKTEGDLLVAIDKAKLKKYTIKATAKSGDTKSEAKSAEVIVSKKEEAPPPPKKEKKMEVSLSFDEIKEVAVGDKKVEGKGNLKIKMENIEEAAKVTVKKAPKGIDIKVGDLKDGAAAVTVTIPEVTDAVIGSHEISLSVVADGVTKEESAKLTVSKKKK